jgi:hypothetical protein
MRTLVALVSIATLSASPAASCTFADITGEWALRSAELKLNCSLVIDGTYAKATCAHASEPEASSYRGFFRIIGANPCVIAGDLHGGTQFVSIMVPSGQEEATGSAMTLKGGYPVTLTRARTKT